MSTIEQYPFDQAGNTITVVDTSSGTYDTDEIEFTDYGVFLVRTGTDRVLLPWSSVSRVYQTIDAAAAALVYPYAAPAAV
jgi:hypothetical protein